MFRGNCYSLISSSVAFVASVAGGPPPTSGTFSGCNKSSISAPPLHAASPACLVTSSDGSIVGSTMFSIKSAHSPNISPDNVFCRSLGQEVVSILLHQTTPRIAPTVDVCMCDEEDGHLSDSLTRLRVQREASSARARAARSSLMTPSEDDVTQDSGEPSDEEDCHLSDSLTRLRVQREASSARARAANDSVRRVTVS